jgi:hypothetical protein
MKLVALMIVLASLFITGFAFSFDWASSIDYTPITQSMAPIAITWMLGVVAVSCLGGLVGAVWEHIESKEF